MIQTNQKQFSSNRTHTRNLNQLKRVISDVTVLSGPLCAVMSICRHTCFASSANESLWALTLECPKDINTCAAILAWIAFTVTVVSTQTAHRNIFRERIVFRFPILLPSLHFRISFQAFTSSCLTSYISLYSKRLLFCVRFFAIGVNVVILLKIWSVLY